MCNLERGMLGGRTECCVDHKFEAGEKIFEILVVAVGHLPYHCPQSLVDSFADRVTSRVVSSSYHLCDVEVFTNLAHYSLHELWSVVRPEFVGYPSCKDDPLHDRLAHLFHCPVGQKFQHCFPGEQIYDDQNFSIVHSIEVHAVALPRE